MWVLMVLALCRPIKYVFSPPSMPDREELLERDDVTGIAHPKQEWKDQKWTAQNHWHELMYLLVTINTLFIFTGSFLYREVREGKPTKFYFHT
jgi:hypothetical protein